MGLGIDSLLLFVVPEKVYSCCREERTLPISGLN